MPDANATASGGWEPGRLGLRGDGRGRWVGGIRVCRFWAGQRRNRGEGGTAGGAWAVGSIGQKREQLTGIPV